MTKKKHPEAKSFKVYPINRDLNKRWYIGIRLNGKLHKFYGNINKLATEKERLDYIV